MAYHLVGLDLGGTKIATALTDTDSRISKYETVPVDPDAGPEAIVAEMVTAIKRVTADVRKPLVLGVGCAMAGMIEPGTGRVLYSPNLHWKDLPLRDMLASQLPWPVFVANDTAMAALGELHYGAARGKRHVVEIAVGTGVGAGLILNGRIYLGAGGFAGELGHTLIEWRGASGTLENLASGTALSRRAAEALAAGRESRLRAMTPPGQPVALETIQAAFDEGDALAVELVSELAEMLGAGVTNVINLLNPEMVVLGGGAFRSLPVLVDRLVAVVERRGLPGAVAGCTIVPGHFGREAGVIGATVFAKLAGSLEASGPGLTPDESVAIRRRVP